MLDVSPKGFHGLVKKGMERWTLRILADEQADLQQLSKGAELRPLRILLKRLPAPGWDLKEQNGLEAGVTRAAPCQSLLEAAGLATDFNCQCCFQEEGIYLHRHGCCDGSYWCRQWFGLHPDLQHAAKQASTTAEFAFFEDKVDNAGPPAPAAEAKFSAPGDNGGRRGANLHP